MIRVSRQGDRRAPRVLVVDPREVDLDRTARGLEASGLKVVSLRRASVLIPVATAFRPHLLIIATRAPAFASLELARRFHQQTHGAVPILYLIDAPDPQLRRHCLIQGLGLDVLSRPLDEVELLTKVNRWLRHDEQVEHAGRNALDVRGPSLRDPLTGVYNRRWLLSMLAQETRRGERHGGSFSILAAKVDHFRALKRERGRERVDPLLVGLSARLSEGVRDSDAVARVGDEEFAIFLPATPQEGIWPLQARLAQGFQEAPLALEGGGFPPRVVFGAASFPDVVGAPARLLSAAFEDLKRSRDGASFGPARLGS
jgi:diguanylate cyclase (GGDEF)-like protein